MRQSARSNEDLPRSMHPFLCPRCKGADGAHDHDAMTSTCPACGTTWRVIESMLFDPEEFSVAEMAEVIKARIKAAPKVEPHPDCPPNPLANKSGVTAELVAELSDAEVGIWMLHWEFKSRLYGYQDRQWDAYQCILRYGHGDRESRERGWDPERLKDLGRKELERRRFLAENTVIPLSLSLAFGEAEPVVMDEFEVVAYQDGDIALEWDERLAIFDRYRSVVSSVVMDTVELEELSVEALHETVPNAPGDSVLDWFDPGEYSNDAHKMDLLYILWERPVPTCIWTRLDTKKTYSHPMMWDVIYWYGEAFEGGLPDVEDMVPRLIPDLDDLTSDDPY